MLSTKLLHKTSVLSDRFVSGRFEFDIHGFLWKLVKDVFEKRDLIVGCLNLFPSKCLNYTQVGWQVRIIDVLNWERSASKPGKSGIMMHNQLIILGQTDIELEHMLKMIKLLKGLHTILRPLPGPSSMPNTKQLIRLNETIEGLINVLHAFVQDVRKDEKKERN